MKSGIKKTASFGATFELSFGRLKILTLRLKQHDNDTYACQAPSQLKFAHKVRNKEN